jgi:hypothetical protein
MFVEIESMDEQLYYLRWKYYNIRRASLNSTIGLPVCRLRIRAPR